MRDKIKEAASNLLIRNGYRGLRFGDIADELKITRANIHYHFGTKSRLVDEVLAEYVAGTIAEIDSVWGSDLSYEDKVVAMMNFNRRRYLAFNASEEVGGAPWSLISRMRLEASLLGDEARDHLRAFSKHIEDSVARAVDRAHRQGEIAVDAPVHDITVQIVAIIDSAGSITQDAGSFVRLEHLYMAHMRVVAHAYGSKRKRSSGKDVLAVAR